MLKVTTQNGAIVRIDPRTRKFVLLSEPNAPEPLHRSQGKFLDFRAEPTKGLILRFTPHSAAFMSKVTTVEQI